MIYSVTKMTILGNEIVGVFSSFEEADGYVESSALNGQDEQRYAIKGWVLDLPEMEEDEMYCPGYDEDEDHDDYDD